MSSSTSSSEPAASSEAPGVEPVRWRRFLAVYGLAVLLGGGLLAAVLCLIDPFDTGRFGVWAKPGVPHMGPRQANASRGRDPQFDSAVIGNSHAQLIEPERLSALSGHRFVSLAIPGTGPTEQLAVARWFAARHEGGVRVLVIGLDQLWCQPDGALVPPNRFPFWLYAPDQLEYVSGLLRTDTLKQAGGRLALLAGLVPAARADGFDDYDQGRIWRAEEVAARMAGEASPWAVPAVADAPSFPALALLRAFLADLPRSTVVALVFTPMHARALPAPGSPGERWLARCKDAYRSLAAAHGPAQLVDMLERGALVETDEHFWDLTHYRRPVARVVEERVAAALSGAEAERR